MEYSFQPQWRQKKFNFPSCQHPVCGRCGNVHLNVSCFAFNQKCYRCHRIGHYSRMCFTQMKKTEPKLLNKGPVPSRKKARDMKRLCSYLENKRILRELPFSSLRDGHFRSLCDTSGTLRNELNKLKIRLRKSNEQNTRMECELKTAESEIEKLKNENQEIEKQFKQYSDNSSVKVHAYLKKIHKLEEDAQGDRVIMGLMQRKLKEIGSEHNQFVMKIQADAEKTSQELRYQNNALLQTIEVLQHERDNIESVLLENQRRCQSRRCQGSGRPRRGRYY